jgi:tetratricopeptide (TPR) repeat protein
MTATWLRIIGLTASLLYATVIVWVYARQPKTMAEVTGGLTASVGAYQIDRASFDEGLRFFRADRFAEARSAFARADPARQDAPTQFYIAYSLVRQGWGRVYSDDALYQDAKRTLDYALTIAPQGKIIVDDPGLRLKSSDELRAEIDRGLTRDASDLNPMRLFRERP